MPKKEKIGKVVSTKMNKIVVVEVTEYRAHPIYKKIIIRHKNYMASDVNNMCGNEDMVRIVESKPLSKMTRWSVAEVTEKAT